MAVFLFDCKTEEVPIVEEQILDAESIMSQQLFRKMRIDPQGGIAIKQKSVKIGAINRRQRHQVWSQKWISKYAQQLCGVIGCSSYLKLFIKLNWNFFGKSRQVIETKHKEERSVLFKEIKRQFIRQYKFIELPNHNLKDLKERVTFDGGSSVYEVRYLSFLQQQSYMDKLRQATEQGIRLFSRKIWENKNTILWQSIIGNFEYVQLMRAKDWLGLIFMTQ